MRFGRTEWLLGNLVEKLLVEIEVEGRTKSVCRITHFTFVRMDRNEKHVNLGLLTIMEKELHNYYSWPCTSRLKVGKNNPPKAETTTS